MSCRLPLVSTPEERLVVAGHVGSIRIRIATPLALRSQPYNAVPIYVSDIRFERFAAMQMQRLAA